MVHLVTTIEYIRSNNLNLTKFLKKTKNMQTINQKNTNTMRTLELKKITKDQVQNDAIRVLFYGQSLGLILGSGEFISSDCISLMPHEMKQILIIAENFSLIFNNVKD